jgi:rhomboid family GlyGly-CTERM serine protease
MDVPMRSLSDQPPAVLAGALLVGIAAWISGAVIGALERARETVRGVPTITLTVAGAALLVAALPGAGSWLILNREAAAGGEVWRLITCHLVHAGGEHLFWDAAALLVLGSVCEWRGRAATAVTLAASAPAVSAAVLIFLPGVSSYCGLSGLDSALFALLAVSLLKQQSLERNRVGLTAVGGALLIFTAKLAYEVASGNALFVSSSSVGAVPVPLAHAVGALCGAAVGLCAGRRSTIGDPR